MILLTEQEYADALKRAYLAGTQSRIDIQGKEIDFSKFTTTVHSQAKILDKWRPIGKAGETTDHKYGDLLLRPE